MKVTKEIITMKGLYLQIVMVGSLMLIAFEAGEWWQSRHNGITCEPTEIAYMEHGHAGQ